MLLNNDSSQNVPAPDPSAEFLTLTEMRAAGPAAVDWLWEGYLAAGNITLLTSLWKSGKTTLLSILLSKLVDGGMLAGKRVRPARVAVLSEESPQHWLARDERLKIGPHVKITCRPFRGRPTPEQWNSLIERLAEDRSRNALDLLVVDPLASFIFGRSENHSAAFMDLLLPLQELTKAGVAVFILHHPKKGNPDEAQAARGSGALAGHIDVLMEMSWFGRPSEGDRRRVLAAYSRHNETPRRRVIELNPEGNDYRQIEDSSLDGFSDCWEVLRGVLEDATGKLSRKEVLKLWPEDHPKPHPMTLLRWLTRAVAEGKVQQSGTGRRNSPFVFWLREKEAKWARRRLRELPPLRRLDEDEDEDDGDDPPDAASGQGEPAANPAPAAGRPSPERGDVEPRRRAGMFNLRLSIPRTTPDILDAFRKLER